MITAEEFMNSKQFEPDEGISFEDYHGDNVALVPTMMIEFAKMHVKAALEAAFDKAIIGKEGAFGTYWNRTDIVLDKNSILTAYPENLIK